MTAAILGFALFSLLVAMAPGPDTLLVLRNCLRGGRRTGSATALGAAVGSLAWGVAAAFGLAAALQRWDAAFTVVRLAGAAYLVLLGAQALWAQRRGAPTPASAVDTPAGDGAPGVAEAFRQGLLSCLLNPKVGVFFVAVVPQFLPEGGSPLGTTLLFGAIDAVVAAAWMFLVTLGATRMLTWLRRPRVHRNLERTTGGVLVAMGVGTAAESV
ncbi:LysE family translocator [Streptomyces griseocarneus]|uniref:LysE family translocator n=1 Tax=Streptomyces griseocarneus TaxID=51201 RepID=UPI00167E82C2|nr:LysE family translocator [Streptomyces griseocarneus]MBZ6472619.1 LysE family translocator [Streptomyces griseocarneus]GHG46323.1 threonine transporter RhtB [Streptomyces griseocarneus]